MGPIQPAGGEVDDQPLLLIDRCIDLGAVEDEEGFHRGMPGALVAVDEGMVLNEGETPCGRLLDHCRIEISTFECRPGLRDRGIERAQVPDACGATTSLKNFPVR